jgi:hypothetical protein
VVKLVVYWLVLIVGLVVTSMYVLPMLLVQIVLG